MEFSPKKTNSRTYCCVYGCTGNAIKNPTLRFHRFPKSGQSTVKFVTKFNNEETVDRRWAWKKVLKLKETGSRSQVCSMHFTKNDYLMPDYPSQFKKLKKSAVPSLNLPSAPVTESTLRKIINDEDRNVRLINRSHKKKIDKRSDNTVPVKASSIEVPSEDTPGDMAVENLPVEAPVENVPEDVPAENLPDKDVPREKPKNSVKEDSEIGVQCDVYKKFVTTEKDLNILSGLPSFDLLNLFEDIVKIVSPKAAKCYSKSKLSIKDRIILTLTKLKQNSSYSMLCVIFRISSEENCRKIFLRMISILSVGLKYAIHWSSKEEVLKNIPTCFNDFLNVRAVIDVIEIKIQRPKNLCCQIATYSSYKSDHTIRFMTAVSPGGLITFISKAFVGRSSDKAIFDKSNFIKLLESGDGLMTDKGFLIDDACEKQNVKLIRPPFLKNKIQFSKEEALLNAKIAKARVHIERSNQRLKIFKILSCKVPSYLVPRMDQIFLIISAIVNLTSPILKDDKFNK